MDDHLQRYARITGIRRLLLDYLKATATSIAACEHTRCGQFEISPVGIPPDC
jgi:hypothetical protein